MALKNVLSTSTHFLYKHRLMLVALFFGIFIPLLIFGKLAEEVWDHEGFNWDIPILNFIHGFATPVRDSLMVLITDAGGVRVMVAVAGAIFLLLLLRRRQAHALFFSLAVGGAAVLNFLAKLFFRRTRPHLWISPVSEHDYGFPSGHAMGSMAVITAIIITYLVNAMALAYSDQWLPICSCSWSVSPLPRRAFPLRYYSWMGCILGLGDGRVSDFIQRFWSRVK